MHWNIPLNDCLILDLHFIAQLQAYSWYCLSFRHASPLGQFFRVASNELQLIHGYSSYVSVGSWNPIFRANIDIKIITPCIDKGLMLNVYHSKYDCIQGYLPNDNPTAANKSINNTRMFSIFKIYFLSFRS